ncbi:hypothetical protein H7171_01925 [Candidatus Saccharibacteria bacterium]|nr:hypothetical protein [Candidatus Saccharibacteria bacterium]
MKKNIKIHRPSRKHLSSLSPFLALPIIIGVTWIGVHVIGFGHADTVSNNFVSHSGNQLVNNGKPFRFAGVNMYWLGLDDNIRDGTGNTTYPTQARINDGFSEASALGSTVVRAHTRYISWLFDLRRLVPQQLIA